MNAQGVDISVWQDNNSTPQMFDPVRARQRGASFVGIKVGQASWADPDYAQNWANCRRWLYRLPYHFLTWDVSPRRQAEVFWSLLEKDTFALLPLTVDFEWWKTTPGNAMDILYNFTERLRYLSAPLPMGIYTAKSFWVPNGSTAPYWKQFYLWLCDISGAVEVPAPWERWTFHQYTFKLHGPDWGAESLDLDGDYYNGTVEDMRTQFGLPELEPVEPPASVPLPVGEPLRMQALVEGQVVRRGPGTSFEKVGQLRAGELVNVLGVGGSDVWVEIEPGQWAAVRYAGKTYMETA